MSEDTIFFERLKQKYSSLRSSEKRVVDFILQNPQDIANYSITELAQKCSTSETTVNRLCHSIGYSGYSQMKISLTQNLAQSTLKTIPGDIKEGDSIIDAAEKLKYCLTSAIEHTFEILNISELNRAIESILKAERIYFYGIGGSGYVARIAYHLFIKAGIFNTACDSGYMQAITASLLSRRDLAIGISHSGETKDVVKALTIAKEKGATTIAITGNKESAIVNKADINLFTFSKEEPIYGDFMEGKASQLFIIDLLYIGILLKNIPAFTNYLEETASAIWDKSYHQDNSDKIDIDNDNSDK
ncbi:MAG: MurR/RpiR family transcriptional regulator [Actinobacteria bacterium]|nr:MurR/RpiR family transcriptional regulator [Actinomycetota bacterium]